ncbi:putative bifunctional diguanylate cyclase/phosphodiesterase [Anoxybacillus flavithermus]|uniref:Diguanylate cyclase n=1 Tax=Anoxybacillus flavithermus AK1 TaxID=1297581 RepID=M8D5N0_9BACL|nr:bifunctional diguanylate cyclase/phosphodiesterase [Anoxybacillus flavithermus]EMT46136.1 diguanylate cyclase [Anoxybacillus flavithermus AK1]
MNEQQYMFQHPPLIKWEAVGQHFHQCAIFFITDRDGTIVYMDDSLSQQLSRRYHVVHQLVDCTDGIISSLRDANVWRGKTVVDDRPAYMHVHLFQSHIVWTGCFLLAADDYNDSLTGALSYESFQHMLWERMNEREPFALLSLNLDRFKFINDLIGYECGNELLKQVAERLQRHQHLVISRQDRDQFFLAFYTAKRHDIRRAIDDVIQSFSTPFYLAEHELTVTPSIGVSVFPDDATDWTTLVSLADLALETAKENGGNAYCFYTNELKKTNEEKLYIQHSIRKALKNDEFTIHYQPIIDIASGQIVAVEALLRWFHPKRGWISPATFIPIAEETNLIQPIGDWVLRQVCEQSKIWREKGMPHVQMGVNISIKQFLQADFVKHIEHVLRMYELDPFCLKLEITESMAMHHMDDVLAQLQSLKHLGLQLAVDDFGTGYSSLNYLKRLPVDIIKIDRSFIQDMVKHSYDLSIVRAVIQVAHSLQMKVVAEGVETEQQLAILQQEGCDRAQGYYFSKPLSAEQFEQLVQREKGRSH